MKKSLALVSGLLLSVAAHATEPVIAPAPSKPKDNWGGAELHVSVSALAGLACRSYYEDNLKAFGCAMVPGTIKEILDSQAKGNRFSGKDMIANALGAAIGVTVGNFVITPKSITYSSTF